MPPKKNHRKAEDARLKLDYYSMFQERYPLNNDIENCSSEASAYLLEEEIRRLSLQYDQDLTYPQIEKIIPEEHKQRLQDIWDKVVETGNILKKTTKQLKEHWADPPLLIRVRDRESSKYLKECQAYIQPEYKNSAISIISNSTNNAIERWQAFDKGLRRSLFDQQKTYIVALRWYLEALLERSQQEKNEKTEWIIPEDNPIRTKIAIHVRYLRLIDSVHQSIAVAKAAHHQQEKGRTRKEEQMAYVTHTTRVTYQAIMDVIPYVLEEPKLNFTPEYIAVAGPLHDVIEDAALSFKDLSDFIERIADVYDSSLLQVIKSGFSATKEDIQRKILDLVKKREGELIKIIRILSDKTEAHNQKKETELNNREKIIALKKNLAGIKNTQEILGITEEELNSWKSNEEIKELLENPSNEAPQSKTFQQFPEEYDRGKLSRFLMRLTSLSGRKKQIQQVALTLKLEDRADNIQRMKSFKPNKQRAILRASVNRLIAWAMLDYQERHPDLPLFNALPTAIDTIAKVYDQFAETHPELIENIDNQLIDQLEKWQIEVKRYEIPEHIQKIKNTFKAKPQPTTIIQKIKTKLSKA
ncbi:hypothetical protein KJ632_05690 [Patescibacteria group bacterium]|nr:hypothetical protein [Patescibacteria group bacterium]